MAEQQRKRGKVYVARIYTTLRYDPKAPVTRVDCTSKSKTVIDYEPCKQLSPFNLGPVKEREVFTHMRFRRKDDTSAAGMQLPVAQKAMNVENYWQYGKCFDLLGHKPGNAAWREFREKGYKKTTPDRHPEGTYTTTRTGNKLRTRTLRASSSMYMEQQMDYLTSRKLIYAPVYAYYATRSPAFTKLKALVDSGTSVVIVDYDIIPSDKPLEVSLALLRDRVNDTSRPFGHGYVLAGLLLDIPPTQYCEL